MHRTSILEKSRINFLRKEEENICLMKIIIDGKEVIIEITDFSESNPNHINIHFTTMQTIYLKNEREGRIAFSDFKDREVVPQMNSPLPQRKMGQHHGGSEAVKIMSTIYSDIKLWRWDLVERTKNNEIRSEGFFRTD